MTEQRTAAVVGCGVIGASWAALLLAHGWHVRASDPGPDAKDRLHAMVDDAWPILVQLGAPATLDYRRLVFCDSAGEAADGVDFVQESGPEDPALKAGLMAQVDEAAPADTVIASSSSGLMPTVIQDLCHRHPERVLVGHPFNPPHLIPLVEVVGGERTSEAAVESAMEIYVGLGRRPVRVRRELPGHIGNRLQMALWREAMSLVQSGAATVADIDTVITGGPGLRWAATGPFTGLQMSGGDGGIRHNLHHMGGAISSWWQTLGDPVLDESLIALLGAQTDEALAGRTNSSIAQARDRLLTEVIRARADEPDLP